MLIDYSIEDLNTVAKKIIPFAEQVKIFLFYGEMGAGKTTLIKELCLQLGIEGPATSPTFSIVNEYVAKNSKLYHFDFYRLKTQTEAFDLGYEEYFYSGNYCFIEWPEKIPDLLPTHFIKINITVTGECQRSVLVEKY